jgi:hypothetical protein
VSIINIYRIIINKWKYKKIIKQPINESIVSLVENTLKLFPDTIDFSDGEPPLNNGFYSANLDHAWNYAQELNAANNVNIDFMIWAIYGVLHQKCIELYNSKVYSVNLCDLDLNKIYDEYIKAYREADVPID